MSPFGNFGKERGVSRFGENRPTPLNFPKKPSVIPSKPKSLFEEKKDWSRYSLRRRIERTPLGVSGGRKYSAAKRKEMIEQALPYKKYQEYISESEAKQRLRGLRKEEYYAKTGQEKIKINRLRKYLEDETGLKGKY
jgi:hypothetical protein